MNSRELNFLADLIDAQRLAWPPEARQLRSVGVFGDQEECWRLLAGVSTSGASSASAAWLLRRLADERAGREALEASVQAVVSGPCLLPGLRKHRRRISRDYRPREQQNPDHWPCPARWPDYPGSPSPANGSA
jgi:hypothetical protein